MGRENKINKETSDTSNLYASCNRLLCTPVQIPLPRLLFYTYECIMSSERDGEFVASLYYVPVGIKYRGRKLRPMPDQKE